MKKQIAKFINDYSMEVVAYLSLAFVYTTDSMIALTFYSVIAHIMVIALVIGLYENSWFSNTTSKRLNFTLLETVFFLIILAVTKHWYTLIVTAIYSFLLIAYINDRMEGNSQNG